MDKNTNEIKHRNKSKKMNKKAYCILKTRVLDSMLSKTYGVKQINSSGDAEVQGNPFGLLFF